MKGLFRQMFSRDARLASARKARVIAVNRFYWPDRAATSQILTDLATDLCARGHPVTVIATRTRYDDTAERLPAREVVDGVRIRRVWSSRLAQRGLAGRAVDYLTFCATGTVALLAEARAGDVVLVKTDPPLFSVPANFVARARGARLITWNHDLFPEVAGALGLAWGRGRLGRLMARLRDASLRAATVNVAISPGMAERIAAAGVERCRIRVIENWSELGDQPISDHSNPLRSAWGLGEAFVIGYSGNLGRAHLADRVAELVRRTYDLPGLAWLFIGGGSGLARVEAVVAETGAANVHFHPYQPRDSLAQSLSVPDLHLVALDPACEGLMMPSKLAGIMAAGRPTLFLGAREGEVAARLARERTGVALDLRRPDEWRDRVAALRAAPGWRAAMGGRARASSAARGSAHSLAAWRGVLAEAAAQGVEVRAPVGAGAHAAGEEHAAAVRRSLAGRLGRLAGDLHASRGGRVLARGIFMALAGTATVVALKPGWNLGDLQWVKDATEPLGHLGAFGTLTLLGVLAWGLRLPLVASLAGLAVTIELAQFLVPGREPYLPQTAAALAGIALAGLLSRALAHARADGSPGPRA